MLHDYGLSLHTLDIEFLQTSGEATNMPKRWRKGIKDVSRRTVEKLAKRLPGTEVIYNVPLWDLIADIPVSSAAATKAVSQYLTPSNVAMPWSFPNDFLCRNPETGAVRKLGDNERIEPPLPSWFFPSDGLHNGTFPIIPPIYRDNSDSLFHRGDLFGFMAIIFLVRDAESTGDTEALELHLCNAYRALPAVGRLPAFSDHWRALGEQLTNIHLRNLTLYKAFQPEWSTIEKQINAEYHVPTLELRPREPDTWCFEMLEDPIVYPEFGDAFDPILHLEKYVERCQREGTNVSLISSRIDWDNKELYQETVRMVQNMRPEKEAPDQIPSRQEIKRRFLNRKRRTDIEGSSPGALNRND